MKTVNPEIVEEAMNEPKPRLDFAARPRRLIKLLFGWFTLCCPALALDSACAWLFDQGQHGGVWLAWPILLCLALPALITTLISALLSLVFVFAIFVTIFGRDIKVSPSTVFRRGPKARSVKTVS